MATLASGYEYLCTMSSVLTASRGEGDAHWAPSTMGVGRGRGSPQASKGGRGGGGDEASSCWSSPLPPMVRASAGVIAYIILWDIPVHSTQ